jgi:hypothetical protein
MREHTNSLKNENADKFRLRFGREL